MKRDWWREDVKEILITQEQIESRVSEMAAQISNDYQGLSPVVVGVMRGAAIFHADLIRQINLDLSIDYISVSSYGDDTQSSGEVQLLKDLKTALEGQHLILVEDIVDTGLTLSFLTRLLSARQPASLKVCSFLSKPDCRKIDVDIDYLGFEIPDRFVVGYGLDYRQNYRNLPFLAVLHDENDHG